MRVKMIDGREIQVSVPRAGMIADVAEKVLEAEDAPVHKMIRLIYGGRLMQPEDPIVVYNIGEQDVIHAGERRKLKRKLFGLTRCCAPAFTASPFLLSPKHIDAPSHFGRAFPRCKQRCKPGRRRTRKTPAGRSR